MEELLELYMQENDIIFMCYEMMGKLLDVNNLRQRIQDLKLKDVYIYGGGYLGIQLYNSIKDMLNVISIVDKSGGALIGGLNLPVIGYEKFRKIYNNEIVIITPIKQYKDIYDDLSVWIERANLLFLGEFQGGR